MSLPPDAPACPAPQTVTVPTFISRGDQRQELDVFGVRVFVAAGRPETHGAASMVSIICPPGAGAPPHRHEIVESFIITRGTLTVCLDGEEHIMKQGDMVQIAPWVAHSFQNNSTEDVEMFSVGSPAGHEDFFRDADALARSGNFNPETAGALCEKHAIELIL